MKKIALNQSSLERRASRIQALASHAIYTLALVVSISTWFIAFRAPLWTDETGSYWEISDGFSHIWGRRGIGFPAFDYILWVFTRIFGTSEVALRSLSIFAMLCATYVLYRIARELFERDTALIAVIIFCLDPIVVFASIDVRPYAFAVLTVNAAIFILLRLRNSDSSWLAALFGVVAAGVVYFHLLFAAILPAFVLCFFLVKAGSRRTMWRQFGVASAAFVLAFLPLIPGIVNLFRSAGTHVYEKPPTTLDLLFTIAPSWVIGLFVVAGLVACVNAATEKSRKRDASGHFEIWRPLVCASLGLIPLLLLYGVSVGTSIHMFASRHLLVAIPGIALCWAFVASRLRLPAVRLFFCVALVALSAYVYLTYPSFREHNFSWKYAIAVAQKNAAPDNAPVIVCSEFPEADYVTMPLGSAKESRLFAPLSYYKLTVPVIPMPRTLNAETVRVGTQFLQDATRKHQRFLAIAYKESHPTLSWLAEQASPNFKVRDLGRFDQVDVLEFTPAR